MRELDHAKTRLLKSETDLKEQLALNQTKQVENQARSSELRKTDSDIASLYQEVSRATKLKDAQLKRLKASKIENFRLASSACRFVAAWLPVHSRLVGCSAHADAQNAMRLVVAAGDRLGEAGTEARIGDDPRAGAHECLPSTATLLNTSLAPNIEYRNAPHCAQALSLDREIEAENKEAAAAGVAAVEVRSELDDLKQALDKAADSTQRQVKTPACTFLQPEFNRGTTRAFFVLLGSHHQAQPEDD